MMRAGHLRRRRGTSAPTRKLLDMFKDKEVFVDSVKDRRTGQNVAFSVQRLVSSGEVFLTHHHTKYNAQMSVPKIGNRRIRLS